MHRACKLLPEQIRQKMKLRDTTRTKNKQDPKLPEIKIILFIQHKTDIWREHLNK